MSGDAFYRKITASVLQRYCELEDGVLGKDLYFDPRVSDYRIDVERALRRLAPSHYDVLIYLHRDGLTQADAVRTAGIASLRPDLLVAQIEATTGKLLLSAGLVDIKSYLR